MPLTHRVDNHSQACTFQKRMASSQKDMEPQGRESGAPVRTRRRSGTLGLRKTTLESRVHVQTVGLNAKKIISALSQGKTFLLTFPFIGSLRAASGLGSPICIASLRQQCNHYPRQGRFLFYRQSGHVQGTLGARVTRWAGRSTPFGKPFIVISAFSTCKL